MHWHPITKVTFEVLGAMLMLIVLADVFLTVLYARLNTSLLSQPIGLATWKGFRVLASAVPSCADRVLSFGGPALLVVLIIVWAVGLTLGGALIFYPNLGTSIRVSGGGPTPTDFASSMFAAAASMSIVGASQFGPQTTAFRLVFMANSLIGLCMLSLTLTYFMQVYSALQKRNVLALQVHLATQETGDAAKLIAAYAHGGDLSQLSSWLAETAQSMAEVKESHHFYALLMYFRFGDRIYSVPRLASVAVDTVSLLRSALDPTEYDAIIKSAAANQLWAAAIRLLTGVTSAMPKPRRPAPPEQALQEWRTRYRAALSVLHQAALKTVEDEQAGEDGYVRHRSIWNEPVTNYAQFMGYMRV